VILNKLQSIARMCDGCVQKKLKVTRFFADFFDAKYLHRLLFLDSVD